MKKIDFSNYLDDLPSLSEDQVRRSGVRADVDDEINSPEPIVSPRDASAISARIRHCKLRIKLRREALVRAGGEIESTSVEGREQR